MNRWLRSLPTPDALREHLAAAYGVPFTGCTLLRSLVNDVYELTAPGGRFVLKLYRAGGRSAAEIRWETALAAHLLAAGLAVPRPVPLVDGTDVGVLPCPEGDRPYVLTEHVDGAKPDATDDLYRDFGGLVARFHITAAGLPPRAPRERPVDGLLPHLSPADAEMIEELGTTARDWLSRATLTYGTCHGDVSLDNLLVTSSGLVLYDFDLAGHGPLAADLTGVAATQHWEAFLAGYTAVAPLTPEDLAAIPHLTVVGRIANLWFHLVDKPGFRGAESRDEGWAARELAALRDVR